MGQIYYGPQVGVGHPGAGCDDRGKCGGWSAQHVSYGPTDLQLGVDDRGKCRGGSAQHVRYGAHDVQLGHGSSTTARLLARSAVKLLRPGVGGARPATSLRRPPQRYRVARLCCHPGWAGWTASGPPAMRAPPGHG